MLLSRNLLFMNLLEQKTQCLAMSYSFHFSFPKQILSLENSEDHIDSGKIYIIICNVFPILRILNFLNSSDCIYYIWRKTMSEFVIKNINHEEMSFLIDSAHREGWNPGINDDKSFYFADPEGFFIGYLDGEPVTCISAVNYLNTFGFIGFYITKPQHRSRGFGMKIWNHAMNYLKNCNIGLDGVLEQQKNYEKQGFRLAHKNIRYKLVLNETYSKHPQVTAISNSFTNKLYHFDTEIFGVDRHSFLKHWIADPESRTFLKMNYDEVSGYATIRKCHEGYKIGPLFSSSFHDADHLMQSLLSVVEKDKPIYLDIPETNFSALELVKRYKMNPVFETVRMYNRFTPELPVKKSTESLLSN